MNDAAIHVNFLRELNWTSAALIAVVLLSCRLLIFFIRRMVRHFAESSPSHLRLLILRLAPIDRLFISIAGIAMIIPIIIEPNFEDIIALIATVSVALAFALKDYVSCLIAGVVTIIENTYQPGDWIEIDGYYGEVKTIGTRAVHIVTADDTEIIIPHKKLWSSSISNASSGKQSLLCVTNFYLHADHDGLAVREVLMNIAETSQYKKAGTAVKIAVIEMPWGTRYKVKSYVNESREQFSMMTDLTLRGKERLRAMRITFAQTVYAENQSKK